MKWGKWLQYTGLQEEGNKLKSQSCSVLAEAVRNLLVCECVLVCVLLVGHHPRQPCKQWALRIPVATSDLLVSNKRNAETERTKRNTGKNGGEWAGSRKNFIIHVNLQSSHLQHLSISSSEGRQSGTSSKVKVTFGSEGQQSGTAPTVSMSRVKGIFYT